MVKNAVLLSTLLSIALLLAFVSAVLAVETLQVTKTLNPTADSFVSSLDPDWNRGRQSDLLVSVFGSEARAFLMFDLSSIPSGASVESAKLKLSTYNVGLEAVVGVYYCPSNDWTEDGITYNNKPSFSPTLIDSVNVTSVYTRYEWNVTDTVASTLENTDKRLSLVLKAETTGVIEFSSRYDAYYPGHPPELVVSYVAPSFSGVDPLLIGLVTIGVAVATLAALTLAYTHRKRKTPTKQPPDPHQNSPEFHQHI